jgi:outer membrane cobalamin receptor
VLKLLYGRAFRAPTARELLVTVGRDEAGENRFVAGNPALRPEAIDTVEGELTVKPARWATLRGAAYGSFLNDQINSVRGDDPQLGTDFYENGGGTTILGGELQGVLTPGRWELDLAWTGTRAVDGPTGFAQYGFPVHMVNGRLGLEPVDGLRLNLLADLVGARPRAEWTPDSGRPDGPAYTLLHAAVATDLLAGGRLRADLSVRNLLDTAYEDLVYQDAANAVNTDDAGVITGPRYPADIAAAGRSVVVGVELAF